MDALGEFVPALNPALGNLRINATGDQLALLKQHFALLLEANRRFNLTRITNPAEAAVRLYADSIAALAWAREPNVQPGSVLDIGSGAGFPAVPLAVLRSDWHITALEATGKKATFIEQAARQLGIANLEAVHAHSHHWRNGRTFDLVACKALGSLSVCLESAAPYLAARGALVVYKTAAIPGSELETGMKLARQLGLVSAAPFDYELPGSDAPILMRLHVFRRTARAKAPPSREHH